MAEALKQEFNTEKNPGVL